MYQKEHVDIAFNVIKQYGINCCAERQPEDYDELWLDIYHMPDYKTIALLDVEIIYKVIDCFKLLHEHPAFTCYVLAQYYPFKQYQLIKYREQLNWPLVSINPNINWTEVNWRLFTSELIHYRELEDEPTEEECVECNENPTFPWSEELIERWNRDVNWCYLAQNKLFIKHFNLVAKYWQYLQPHQDLIQETGQKVSYSNLQNIEWKKECFPSRIKFIRQFSFTERDLKDNADMLWCEWLESILNDEVVDYLLPKIFELRPYVYALK